MEKEIMEKETKETVKEEVTQKKESPLKKTKNPGRQAAGKKLSEWNRNRKEDASLINKQIEEQEMKYMKNNSYLMPAFVGFGTLIGILYYVRRQVRADSQIVASDEIKPNNEVIKNNIFEL